MFHLMDIDYKYRCITRKYMKEKKKDQKMSNSTTLSNFIVFPFMCCGKRTFVLKKKKIIKKYLFSSPMRVILAIKRMVAT